MSEQCEICDRMIGVREEAHIWGEKIVCSKCMSRLEAPPRKSASSHQRPGGGHGITTQTRWAGIIALLVGLFLGGWAGVGVWTAQGRSRLAAVNASVQSARDFRRRMNEHEVAMDHLLPLTPGGRSARVVAREAGERAWELESELRAEEYMTRGWWGGASWAIMLLGGSLILIAIIVAVRTRKRADVGLGICTIVFFTAAIGAAGVVTGIGDAGLHAKNKFLRQQIESSRPVPSPNMP